jgi:hypothetical protein
MFPLCQMKISLFLKMEPFSWEDHPWLRLLLEKLFRLKILVKLITKQGYLCFFFKYNNNHLGGAHVHCNTSGVTDHFASNEIEALQIARNILSNVKFL